MGCAKKYDHRAVEKKWQNYWREHRLFHAEIDPSKPKYYVLDMFPYPSGAGLHVGHVTGYTASDIIARYKRQKGFNVLHPMGWDSFGLQAEQYAIRTGTHPRITTEKNIATYRRQLESLGFSYDWDREVTTSDPEYYKWTQWIFSLLYKKGLAYEAEVPVNYCPALKTVLANEEVENGRSVNGGYPVEQRPLRQWILKITDYADRLVRDLDLLDWPDHLKALQKKWVGKREGVKIRFFECIENTPITIFTTCPGTLFGMTFLALSPEHPLIDEVTREDRAEAVEAYIKAIEPWNDSTRSERERAKMEKRGVWTGAYVRNPLNGIMVPIWVAEYVLMEHGTGAVMGVPGGDERDFAFAEEHRLPILPIFEPRLETFTGRIPLDKSLREIKAEVIAGKRPWEGDGMCINSSSDLLSIDGMERDMGESEVMTWLEERDLAEKCVFYKLRDWLFSRQRYWGEPFPILHFSDGSKRLLDLDELPLTLPELSDYQPRGEGHTPLDRAEDWKEVWDEKRGMVGYRETNTMPQWAGSCWYYLRFCDPRNGEKAWGEEAEKYWMPVDLYIGGAEHAVLHLLYARFWHKVLYDCGYVQTVEPFLRLRNQGVVTAKTAKRKGGEYISPDLVEYRDGRGLYRGEMVMERVEKMSKSKLNGVTPDEIVETYGADALRLYEMFMGPFDKEKLWNSRAVSGCRRFLDRFYRLVHSDRLTDREGAEGMKLAHRLVHEVEGDIESMHFNTAIAKMMEFITAFAKLREYPKQGMIMAVQALAPFAPHLAEECWEHLTGEVGQLSYAPYPKADLALLKENEVMYIIQIDGKVRAKRVLAKGLSQESIFEIVKEEKNIQSYIEGKEIADRFFVPNKLLNIVLRPPS